MAGFPKRGDQRVSSAPAEYDLKQLLRDASTRWLKPAEICEILNNHHQLTLAEASPVKPPSGSLFLFDRNKLRYFRKDGHNWRKKKDGRTVREAHEKLKVGNKDAIHCYYAHGEDNPNFQRRSYWLLEGGYENIVLVHYREVNEGSRLEASPRTCEESPSQIYSQMQPSNMTYGDIEYFPPISSPSEVVSSSYNSQEGLLDIDSGDDFGDTHRFRERISQAYQASALERSLSLDPTPCINFAPPLVAPGADNTVHPSRPIGTTLSNTLVNGVSQYQHALQDTYGQGASNKELEEGLAALPWSNLLESTYPAGDNSANWTDLSQSQQTTIVKNIHFTTGSYNDQLAYPGVYMGQGVDSNEAWSFEIENQPNADYKATEREDFRTKPAEIETTNNGLLSPTVSLFMQSIQSELARPTLGTSWGNTPKDWGDAPKDQDGIAKVSSLPGGPTLFGTSPESLFSIVDFAPEWSYAFEETKVLVTGVFMDPSRSLSSIKWACKFGEVEIPADVLQPGILRCRTPFHKPGRVPFCITCSDGIAYSNIKEFEFRDKSSVESSDKSSIGASREREADKLTKQQEQDMLHKIRLAKYLLTREGRASAEESSNDLATTPKRTDKPDLLVVDDNCWIKMEALVRSDQHSHENAKEMLGQAFFKSALQQWLERKSKGESIAALDKHGLGVLHMTAALGYEWAIAPLLTAGVGVNFRDERGWTALHWAASCGREKVIALLLAAGASPGALTDPTPKDPTGRTASDLAASMGHNGIAGYLGEAIVTSHFTSLNLSEMSKLSAAVAQEKAIAAISERSTVMDPRLGVTDDELSLRDSLAAVRNAAHAGACITATFRAYSFQRQREKEDAILNEFGMLEEGARAFAAAQPISRGYSALEKSNLAATQIQCKYRGWKVRSHFLSLKKHVVRIQAHVRGHQARKKYKKILWTVGVLEKVILRWRRKGSGLRGYKAEGIEDEDSDDDAYLKDFRKQKEAAFGEAVGRVKQMIENPEARSQYRRMLEIYQKEKGAQLDEEFAIFDDDELMGLLG